MGLWEKTFGKIIVIKIKTDEEKAYEFLREAKRWHNRDNDRGVEYIEKAKHINDRIKGNKSLSLEIYILSCLYHMDMR